MAQKYYWLTFSHNLEAYVKSYDVCLALKTVYHKPYSNLELLLEPMHQWKDLSINFITSLPISINWKRKNYDSILVIIDWLIKMVYYKSVKITINAPGFAKVIINVVMRYHGLLDSIVINKGLFFTLKFWSLLCYFFYIKQRLFITFYCQTNSQIERQNSIIKAYL